MNGFQGLKNGILIWLVLTILICFVLTSCLEVKQKINVSKDGSGSTKLEIAIQKEILFDPQAIPRIKNELQKGGWNILGEVEKEGKHVINAARKFKKISELNDDEARYTFYSERKGFLKKSYALEINHIKSSDMPFPYEVSIEMPGDIDETNGTKTSSDEIKWNLQGFRRGIRLSVKSSGLLIPTSISVVIVVAGLLLLFVGVLMVSKIIRPTVPPRRVVSKSIFCTQCGKENPGAASFCTNCGQRLE